MAAKLRSSDSTKIRNIGAEGIQKTRIILDEVSR